MLARAHTHTHVRDLRGAGPAEHHEGTPLRTYIHDCHRSLSLHDLPPAPPNQWALSPITLYNDPLFEPMDICGGRKTERFKLQLVCPALLEQAALTRAHHESPFDRVGEPRNAFWGRCCWATDHRKRSHSISAQIVACDQHWWFVNLGANSDALSTNTICHFGLQILVRGHKENYLEITFSTEQTAHLSTQNLCVLTCLHEHVGVCLGGFFLCLLTHQTRCAREQKLCGVQTRHLPDQTRAMRKLSDRMVDVLQSN